MTDSLRSIIEGMEHFGCPDCYKCRLQYLLAEADCDLVKKWRGNWAYTTSDRQLMPLSTLERRAREQCAYELEIWLAVHLPRIKAEARLEEFDLIKQERPVNPMYWDMHHRRELSAQGGQGK